MKLSDQVLLEAQGQWQKVYVGSRFIGYGRDYDSQGRYGEVSTFVRVESGELEPSGMEWTLSGYGPEQLDKNQAGRLKVPHPDIIQTGKCNSYEDGMEACDQAYEEEFGS